LLRSRIRLLRVPNVHRSAVPAPNLLIRVVDVDGGEYDVATLAEGVAHLRSTRGLSLEIRERLSECSRPGGDRLSARTIESSEVAIDRTPEGFVIRVLEGGIRDDDREDIDYSTTSVVDLPGRSKVIVTDVYADRPSPAQTPLPPYSGLRP
jgi:hypothetical protein